MCVHVCMWKEIYTYTNEHVHGSQRLTLVALFNPSLPCFLRESLSLNLELTSLASLVDQQAPGILWSPAPPPPLIICAFVCVEVV